jgi:hypothetical protein
MANPAAGLKNAFPLELRLRSSRLLAVRSLALGSPHGAEKGKRQPELSDDSPGHFIAAHSREPDITQNPLDANQIISFHWFSFRFRNIADPWKRLPIQTTPVSNCKGLPLTGEYHGWRFPGLRTG